ncbi:MAG: cadherin-like domain-containing protein [Hyphomicrobiaceae bacterium]
MEETKGVARFGVGTIFRGKVRKARAVDIAGEVEGEISSARVIVRPGGLFVGVLRVDEADIAGEIKGDLFVRSVLRIGATGRVIGKVQYGAITLSEGGELVADLHNVPPRLAGDLDLTVHQGRAVAITPEDLAAIDPDDAPEDLTFLVSRPAGGHVAFASAPATAIERFTQADIDAGHIVFQHDGATAEKASFEVRVRDDSGATSGASQLVSVTVVPLPDRHIRL